MNQSTNQSNQPRLFLLSWIVLPMLMIWLIISYLVGNVRSKPIWSTEFFASQNCQVSPSSPPPVFIWENTGLVSFWFDDGWASQYSIAYPILERNGMKATVSVITSVIGTENYLTWPQINLLSYKNWEISSHSVNHFCEKEKMTSEIINSELINSKEELEKQGLRVNTFTIPCGLYIDQFKKVAKNHYLAMRTSFPGLNSLPVIDPYNLKILGLSNETKIDEVKFWLEAAKINKQWLIIVFHQIENSQSEYAVTPENLNQIVKLVIDSKLPVVLPSQVLSMVVMH